MSTSEQRIRLFVYLQRPDTGQWVTAGRFALDEKTGRGSFLYAPSDVAAGLSWAIDPVNLPFKPATEIPAHRYRGLADVLRDACPDSWGQAILRREKGLPANAHDYRYLVNAKNGDRWGALAVGFSARPSVASLASPPLASLQAFATELIAMSAQRPTINQRVRQMIVGRPSLGGARPKGIIRDQDDYWLVKPKLASDSFDVPLLEHTTAVFGRNAGLRFAETRHACFADGISVLRVKRFDRRSERRLMAISGATMLATEFPGASVASEWSYPRLAEELLRIGAPEEDRKELFFRMIFNGLLGNDDDHPRNHAAIFVPEENRWRLSPAFDVVPNWDETPTRLLMQTSLNSFQISRTSVLADSHRFGFQRRQDAQQALDEFLQRASAAHDRLALDYRADLRQFFESRLVHGRMLLKA